MVFNACAPLQSASDSDSTYFVRFLRITISYRKSAVLPNTGMPRGTRPVGAKIDSELAAQWKDWSFKDIAKHTREELQKTARKNGKQSNRFFNTALSLLQRGIVKGSFQQDLLFSAAGVHWLVGMQHKQTWTCTGLSTGRLLSSVPVGVYPDTKRVDVKIWNKTLETSKVSELGEALYTTELTSNDRWSLSTKKLYARETASEINPSATLNSIGVIVPSGVKVDATGSLGISGTFSNNISEQVDTGNEQISETTENAASSLKSSRTVEISVTRESGTERTVTETLSNPNRGSTLNYMYWEILESYDVTTAIDRLDLYLSVPMDTSCVIDAKWLLLHECQIRPHLNCETLAKGFAAAHDVLKLNGQIALIDAQIGAAPKATSASQKAADKLEADLAAVIEIYDLHSNANPATGQIGSWEYWGLVGIVAGNDLKRGLERLKIDATALPSNATAQQRLAVVDDAFQIIGPLDDVFARVSAAIASLVGFSVVLGCSLVPPLGIAIVVLITTLAVSFEALGLDMVPDDEGLEAAVRKLQKSRDSYRNAVAAPPIPAAGQAGYDPVARAAAQREALMNKKIEVEIEYERLAQHVRDEIFKYHHAIWATWSAGRIAQAMKQAGVPTGLLENRFIAFDLDCAILKVANLAEVKKQGLNWDKFQAETLQNAAPPKTLKLKLPAPGVWAEASRGACDALDQFVAKQREIDVKMKEAGLLERQAQAAQAELESERLKERIKAGKLDDPQPYGHVEKLVVHLDDTAGIAAPISPATAP